ncbi:MAG: hypothetical protein PHC92_01645 [Syntrophomonadaceae bacterium]|nr:hypothetical protein [Syntrophomonadaceae bacterium]MDD3024063.1 hypothetical protein [Syntrophomonadaceae bacterium]
MRIESILFTMLLFAFLLLELSIFGYIKSDNVRYILSASISTAALCSISYLLYEIANQKIPQTKKDYYFYFMENKSRLSDEPFFNLPAMHRK